MNAARATLSFGPFLAIAASFAATGRSSALRCNPQRQAGPRGLAAAAVELPRREAPLDSDGQATRLRRLARMVTARKEGKCVHYHLVGPDIASLWVAMREAAEEHLVELRAAVEGFSAAPNTLEGRSREELIGQAERGEVVLIDVRPRSEFEAAHLPFARSMPLEEVAARIAELSSRHWRLRHSSPRSPLSRGPRPCRA